MKGEQSTRKQVLTILFLASVFVLALTKIENTDAWTHLSFGRWIWEHGAIPTEEPFITTSKPFPYNNWLFGLVYYIAYLAFNIPGVILLKALIAAAIFLVLLKDSLRPHGNLIIALLVMTIVLLMVRERFTERPDTFMMLFLSFTIFSLNAYLYDENRYIYFLPIIHILWSNSHTSIPLMFVPFLSFIIGGIAQRALASKLNAHDTSPLIALSAAPSLSQIKTVSLIFAVSFLASLMSPYFLSQYTHSVQALSSDWWKQEIYELRSPTWEDSKLLFMMTPLMMIALILNRKRLSLIDLLMMLPFLALSLTARRFIWLFALISPILVRNLSSVCADYESWSRSLNQKLVAVAVSLWIIVGSVFMILRLKPFDVFRDQVFGFGTDYRGFPEGALRFMDENGIEGRVFNLFQWGGYITWRDFPKRIPLIDGRGFLASDLLEMSVRMHLNAPVFEKLHGEYDFDSALVRIPNFPDEILYALSAHGQDLAMAHPGWALVYWDDLCLLYLQRGGRYEAVIQEHEYRFIKPANGIERAKLGDQDFRAALLKDLERNKRETGSSKAYAFLGDVFKETGLYREAIEMYSLVQDFPFGSHLQQAYAGIADAYAQLGNVDESIRYYKKALSLGEETILLQNLGGAYELKGDKRAAVRSYQKALNLNSDLASVYLQLISLYQELGMKGDAEKTRKLYQAANVRRTGEDHFQKGTKAYLARNFNVAIAEFQKSIAVNSRNPTPYSNLAYVYYDTGDLNKAFEYHKRALDIDAHFGASHYGLALVYKAKGDGKMAVKHWEEYLRIEPSGYYSRRAKEQIKILRQ